jgi:hypothetical protein
MLNLRPRSCWVISGKQSNNKINGQINTTGTKRVAKITTMKNYCMFLDGQIIKHFIWWSLGLSVNMLSKLVRLFMGKKNHKHVIINDLKRTIFLLRRYAVRYRSCSNEQKHGLSLSKKWKIAKFFWIHKIWYVQFSLVAPIAKYAVNSFLRNVPQ